VNLLKIKRSIDLYFFRKELKKVRRNKQVTGYEEANRIGILFDASSLESWSLCSEFIRKLESEGKKVKSLGYIKKKKQTKFLLEQMNMSFFHRSDLDWRLRRKNNRVLEFENISFDLLIDLSPAEILPTKFVAGISKARFKVGLFKQNNVEVFDLMINLKDFELQELMQQVVFYLKMIKKPVAHVGKV
jgi:hypothetical protein